MSSVALYIETKKYREMQLPPPQWIKKDIYIVGYYSSIKKEICGINGTGDDCVKLNMSGRGREIPCDLTHVELTEIESRAGIARDWREYGLMSKYWVASQWWHHILILQHSDMTANDNAFYPGRATGKGSGSVCHKIFKWPIAEDMIKHHAMYTCLKHDSSRLCVCWYLNI